MNGLPYYKAYPRDFIEGTIGMPFELKGAYRLVLDLIYMQGGSLPDDARYISGLLGCSVRKWNSFRQELIARGKLQVSGESLTNYRAVIELETLAKVQEKQSQNASRPRKNNNLAEPRLNHTEPDTDTDKKETPKPPKGGSSPTPKQPIRQAKNPMGWPADGWERFWLIYPNKVGKADARKAFDRAQARASIPFEALIAGLEAYVSKNRRPAMVQPLDLAEPGSLGGSTGNRTASPANAATARRSDDGSRFSNCTEPAMTGTDLTTQPNLKSSLPNVTPREIAGLLDRMTSRLERLPGNRFMIAADRAPGDDEKDRLRARNREVTHLLARPLVEDIEKAIAALLTLYPGEHSSAQGARAVVRQFARSAETVPALGGA